MVEQQLHDLLSNKAQLSRWLDAYPQSKPVAEILAKATELSERYRQLDDQTTKHEIISRVFRKIMLKSNAVVFEIAPSALLATLSGETPKQKRNKDTDDIATITLAIELKRRGVESRIVLQDAAAPTSNKDPMLVSMIARAHLYLEALIDGTHASHADVASRFNAHGPDVSRILPMAFLSPKITEAILTGQQPVDLTIAKLTRMLELPIEWKEQQALLMN